MDHVRRAQSPLTLRDDNAPPPILFDELVCEILSWLPAKSLCRFKCVCKYWKSIISDSYFIKEHSKKSPKNSVLILTSKKFRVKKFASSFSVRSLNIPSSTIITEDLSYRLDLNIIHRIVGSCNGLVCFVVECAKYFFRFWNPATRQISTGGLLVYGERLISSFFGFGYDNLNDTYKVVAILMAPNKDAEVKLYSFDNTYWRNIRKFPLVRSIVQKNGVYLNGTLNWLAISESEECIIVSLDLGEETYTQLLPPCGLEVVSSTIGVLMDCLCRFDYEKTHFVVWQMKEFGVQKSWTRLLNVSYQDIPIDGVRFTSLSPLRMYENGDILIMMPSRHQLIRYDPRDNRVEHITTSKNSMWMEAVDYVQSLVSPR